VTTYARGQERLAFRLGRHGGCLPTLHSEGCAAAGAPRLSTMDIEGARILSERIAQQEHWAQAPAVREGRAPSIDPDVHRLTEVREGLRIYDSEIGITRLDGRPAKLTRVYCKRLVDGEWHGFFDEQVIPAG
jgi:hypothetical protein